MSRHARIGDTFWAVASRSTPASRYPIVRGMHWGIVIDPADPLTPRLEGVGFTRREDAESFRASLPTHYPESGKEIPASDRELIHARYLGEIGYVQDLAQHPTA